MQRVQHAAVGCGGKGGGDIAEICSHKAVTLVAGADVDVTQFERQKEAFPEANFYQDWREMFDKADFDTVSVSTPDHMHAIVGLSAMNLGKHVYGQKPLAQRVKEARALAETAERTGLVTQMGNQLASGVYERLGVEMMRARAIGDILEVHVFSHKNWGDDNPTPPGEDPIPATLDWDLWCGVSPKPSFKKGYYHPSNWRRRQHYGTGCLGDMGCHIFNASVRGLGLTKPTAVTSEGGVTNPDNWATREKVRYDFTDNEYAGKDGFSVTWYSGAIKAPEYVLANVPENERVNQGTILIGTEGVMQVPHGGAPRLYPKDQFLDFKYPKLQPRNHYHEFIDCVMGTQKEKPVSHFGYAGPMTEFILLGTVASLFPDQRLEWDAANCTVTNFPKALPELERNYREGWEALGAKQLKAAKV